MPSDHAICAAPATLGALEAGFTLWARAHVLVRISTAVRQTIRTKAGGAPRAV